MIHTMLLRSDSKAFIKSESGAFAGQLYSAGEEAGALTQLYARIHSNQNYYGSAWRADARVSLISGVLGNRRFNSRVLDLGCRDGFLSDKIFAECSITGVDVDLEGLERCKERALYSGNNVRTVHADLNQKIPVKGSFDVVFAGEVIEHLIDPSLLISEAARLMSKQSFFVGSTPNAARLDKRIQLLFGRDPKEFSDPTHLQYFTSDSLSKVLSKTFPKVTILAYRDAEPCRFLPTVRSDGFIFLCQK
jgi:2-polyprenyl-3-methyl-5-hydroxy-6-metoxy-1,4-benzoquinol methylase